MTAAEFLELPDDGKRYELIEGEVVLNASPVTRHQRISRVLLVQLDRYFEERGGGEVFDAPYDVVLDEENVVVPDLVVVTSDRAAIINPRNVHGAPSIVIEVLSDSTRRKDEIGKRKLYERAGVAEYWIVDPAIDAVKIYRRDGDRFGGAIAIDAETGGTLTSPLLPGFALDVRRIFPAE